jgi:hypothetical protein
MGATDDELPLEGEEPLFADDERADERLATDASSSEPEPSPVDSENPVDAVSDETALCAPDVAAADVGKVLLALVSIANVSAMRAPRAAAPVAIRVRRLEVMAPVVPGDLKTSVRVRLRSCEPPWTQHQAAAGRYDR